MPLTDEQLVTILDEMISARVYSQRMFNLQRQGKFPLAVPVDGEEAAIVASVAALDPETDWLIPQYREPFGFGRYGPEVLEQFVIYMLGHPAGGHIPEPLKVFPPQISLSTQIQHAVGVAWAQQIKNEAGVTLVYFGDGSSSEGDFYEAGNFAGVLRAPIIFFCMNNGWAISTPTSAQTAAISFSDKAVAFGFPGVTVDGNNVHQVHEAVEAARVRALAGEGPTLIEAVTYRLGAHTSSDDPTRYVDPAELEAATEREPIRVLRAELEERGLWDDARHTKAETEALARFDAIFERAIALPVDPADLFDHVFHDLSPTLEKQRSQLLSGEA